jgi:hypothetical protein
MVSSVIITHDFSHGDKKKQQPREELLCPTIKIVGYGIICNNNP